ncbi:MAG: Gfo/Idh/MocA family oxidoreductase [Chloroflexota bacterium]
MTKVRMAQYGTQHGHAAGKLAAMVSNPDVEMAGVYEPDPARRRALAAAGGAWAGVRWFASEDELLGDPTIVAVASEGLNRDSLAQTETLVRAGKHVWYDKPAGEDWPRWQVVAAQAAQQGTYIQMGYMFRYHEGFARIAEWARDGMLGHVFAIRAHMSTRITAAQRQAIHAHRGGILFDLSGHMLDQIVWTLGRPERVTSFLRHDDDDVPGFADNTLAVLEFERAMAMVDIAAMEPAPMARRYEVYGTAGSAILLEPFEPAQAIRLCLTQAADGYAAGVRTAPVTPESRQSLYEKELAAFLGVLAGARPPTRPLAHEMLVQETLLRCTGVLPG